MEEWLAMQKFKRHSHKLRTNVTFQQHYADSIKSKRKNRERSETPLLNFDLETFMRNFLRVVSAMLRETTDWSKQSQPVELDIQKDRRQITAGQWNGSV